MISLFEKILIKLLVFVGVIKDELERQVFQFILVIAVKSRWYYIFCSYEKI